MFNILSYFSSIFTHYPYITYFINFTPIFILFVHHGFVSGLPRALTFLRTHSGLRYHQGSHRKDWMLIGLVPLSHGVGSNLRAFSCRWWNSWTMKMKSNGCYLCRIDSNWRRRPLVVLSLSEPSLKKARKRGSEVTFSWYLYLCLYMKI